jgi:diaminopimelate epimerase
LEIVKAHAFGNDFLLLDEEAAGLPPGLDRATLTRAVCNRHRGIGADGLIFFRRSGPFSASMALLNADGSYSEISGNGIRCLAAWLAGEAGPGTAITIETDAGPKRLELLERVGARTTFRAAMGPPEDVTRTSIAVEGVPVDAVTLRVGNPQCVVLGAVTEARLHGLAAKLAVHPHFPAGTNVELATVESPGQVRILIWERGVGPTEASGTGACAAAVAAMQYGGAHRDVAVVSPGGTQRVEWRDDGLYLTGSADIIAVCQWQRDASGAEWVPGPDAAQRVDK